MSKRAKELLQSIIESTEKNLDSYETLMNDAKEHRDLADHHWNQFIDYNNRGQQQSDKYLQNLAQHHHVMHKMNLRIAAEHESWANEVRNLLIK